MIKDKVTLHLYIGEQDKAKEVLQASKDIVNRAHADIYHYLEGLILFHFNKRPEA